MTIDRAALSTLEVSELDALLSSAGCEMRASRPAGTRKHRVVISHRIGESTGFGDTLLSAIVEAAYQCEMDGGLAFLECAS